MSFLMLTICEDAILGEGHIDSETSGSFFRAAYTFGLTRAQLDSYAARAAELAAQDPDGNRFPERVLQELDQD